MSEETNTVGGKNLSAEELLRNKGICHKAWTNWDESSRTLPKIGASKQFEPSGSWLENKQIEKGLKSREFLLGIERVERGSQLASAEWLPQQKRARVTKRMGNDWANFGHEINANLYLMPEEALILLETECLELSWDGVPLSIQQAYEVLIESEGSSCTLAEYRVYSQLTRLGYRLQRFHYEKSLSERFAGDEENAHRKKVIVDPENGLWMASPQSKQRSARETSKPEVETEIKEIVESMVVTVNGNSRNEDPMNDASSLPSIENNAEKCAERKTKNARVEIISEQTILSPIKIVKDGVAEHNTCKFHGARIQRNVKLLPKRNDRVPLTGVGNTDNSKYEAEKRKLTSNNVDAPEVKKSKHEIIELSDDEIEEIPRPMTRMEMLNCLPNIANQLIVTETIAKRYIPVSVRSRDTYRYDARKLREGARATRSSNAEEPSVQRESIVPEPWTQQRSIVPYCPQYSRFSARPFYRNEAGPFSQSAYALTLLNVQMNALCAQQMSMNRVAGAVRGVWQQNRWSSYRMNFTRNTALMGYAPRNFFTHNYLQMQTQRNQLLAHQGFQHRPHGRCLPERAPRESFPPSSTSERSHVTDNRLDHTYTATFAKIPGASSWTELKQKWRDAKTVTIDDEDSTNHDEYVNEIQVIDQTIKSLISAKNFRDFPEAHERLRIIKSAPERTVRRKRGDLKISYNVYSSTQHYRKANPGMPIFHLVVTTRTENVYLQPVELNRLQQDGKGAPLIFAHVSNSSIAYVQSGIIKLPNLI